MPAFFHNVLFMLVLTLGMGLGIAPAIHAEAVPASAEAVEKLQDRVIELEKETAVLKAELGTRVDAQDNRIADGIGLHGAEVTKLSNQTSMLGVKVAVLGGLIAFVTIFAAIAGYFSFSQAAKNAVAAAKDEAIEESGKWFRENERELTDRISALGQQVEDVQKHAAETKLRMKQAEQDVDDHAAETRVRIEQAEAAMVKGEKPSAEVVKQVEQDALNLDAKPRSQWTSDDFFNSGVYNYTAGDYYTALNRFDVFIGMVGDSNEPEMQEKVAQALFNKGITLEQIERSEDAIAVYDEIDKRFGTRSEPALLELVAKALVNKGFALGEFERSEEVIAVCDEVMQRFGARSEPALFEQVAMALVNKGVALVQLNRTEEAIAVYDEVVQRFGTRSEPAFLKSVAKALLNKGNSLGRLERLEEAIAVYDEVEQQFGAHSEPELLEQVAKALVNKGYILGQLKRSGEAMAVYDEVDKRFGTRSEPELLEAVAKARRLLSKLKGEQK